MKMEGDAGREQTAGAVSRYMSRHYSDETARCRVTFHLPAAIAPSAKSVHVAGTFNNWSVERYPMRRLENGDFTLDLDLEAGQEHQFRFVIDGVRWQNAVNADKFVWNDFAQCDNSVIVT